MRLYLLLAIEVLLRNKLVKISIPLITFWLVVIASFQIEGLQAYRYEEQPQQGSKTSLFSFLQPK